MKNRSKAIPGRQPQDKGFENIDSPIFSLASAHARFWSKLKLIPAWFLVCLGLGLGVTSAFSQSPGSPGRRYLLIVETSKPMDRRLTGMLQTIQQLLGSGLRGELRPGDTLGIWTYNSALFTGQFPLQHFTPQGQSTIANGVVDFLKRQKYDGNPDWQRVLPALQHVVHGSPALTIIIVTAGTDALQGTPFDTQINQSLNSWRDPQQSARMPTVIALRARAGIITHWAVTAAPWPVELPPLPIEKSIPAPVAKTPAPHPGNTTAGIKPPSPAVQPLIVIGKKSPPATPVPAPTNAAVAAIQTPAATNAQPVSAAPVVEQNPASPTSPSVIATTTAVPPASPPDNVAADASANGKAATPETWSDSGTASAAPPGQSAIPAQVATAPLSMSSHRALFPFIALAGLSAGIMALFLFWRRSHRPEQISLITRSFERQAEVASQPAAKPPAEQQL